MSLILLGSDERKSITIPISETRVLAESTDKGNYTVFDSLGIFTYKADIGWDGSNLEAVFYSEAMASFDELGSLCFYRSGSDLVIKNNTLASVTLSIWREF